MNILFVSDSYYPHINGVYYFVSRIGPLLQAKGHRVAVIAPSGTMHSFKGLIDGLDVYGLASLPLLTYPTIRIPVPFRLKSQIRRIIQSFRPDIIHIQDHFIISKMVVEVNEDLKIPIIGTNHLMPENFTAFLHWRYLKQRFENFIWNGLSRVFNRVSVVTTPSEAGVKLIRSRLKVNVIAISNGVSLEKFSPKGDLHGVKEKYDIPDKPILLYVGRLDPEKHIEEILKSVAVAVKKIDFRFVIVGKGTRKAELEQLTRELGIRDKVIFTGFVSDDDLPCFYKISRCFIIASIAELLSLVTLQAMASGLPVIAVDAGALPELVKDKINGFLYKEGDIHDITQHIEDILIHDDLYHQMSYKSLELAKQHDIYKTLDSFEKIYERSVLKVSEKSQQPVAFETFA